MRDHFAFNFKSFFAAQHYLECEDWEVENPAEADVEYIIRPLYEGSGVPDATDKAFVLRDVEILSTCDAIYLLKGFSKSVGATAELAVARWLGLKIYFQDVEEERQYAREGEGGSCED
jgi:hypothetical protein